MNNILFYRQNNVFSNKILFIVILFFLDIASTLALDHTGTFIENYSKQKYKASCQNWNSVLSKNGILYVANNSGLLTFNGNSWNLYQTPDQKILNAVTLYQDTLFSGSLNDIGFWMAENGKFVYTSLKNRFKELSFRNETFSTLIPCNDQLVFKSERLILFYKNGQITTLPIPGNSKLIRTGNKLILHVPDDALYYISEGKLEKIAKSENIARKEISCIEIIDSTLIIGTKQSGIYEWNKGKEALWPISVQSQLGNAIITCSALSDNKLFVGTKKQGLFIFSRSGELESHLSIQSGLQDNLIHHIFVKDNKQIWISFDNGISCLTFESPIYLLKSRSEIGKLNHAILKNGDLYISTNIGIYRQQPDDNPMYILDNEEEVKYKQMQSADNLLRFLPSSALDSLLPIRKLVSENEQVIWGIKEGNRVCRIRLNAENKNIEKVSVYSYNEGITTPNVSDIAIVDDIVVLATGNGLFRYDKALDRFFDYTELNSQDILLTNARMIFPAFNNCYWLSNGNEAALFCIKDSECQLKCRICFSNYNLTLVNQEKRIIALSDSLHLISTMEGVVLVNTRKLIESNLQNNYFLELNSISYTEPSTLNKIYVRPDQKIKLPHNHQQLNIEVYTSLATPTHQISYKLSGIQNEWSAWQSDGDLQFLQLPAGKYKLSIRKYAVKGPYPEIHMTIVVKPPFYLSVWAICGYIIITGLLFYFITIQYLKRAKKQEEEKTRIAKWEEMQEVIRLKNEILQKELRNKNNELSLQTTALIKRNQLLQDIQSEIDIQKEQLGERYPNKSYQKLKKLIDDNLNDQNDWIAFESYFNSAHQDFIVRLRNEYPDLTPNDLRICCLLRMNLSSKEIASLQNITIRAVELRRFRLRRRLKLENDDNLINFLLSN